MSAVCLEAEVRWIRNNVSRYDSHHHAELVIRNITKRYEAARAKQLLAAYEKSKDSEDLNNLFEFIKNDCKLMEAV